MLWEWQRAIRDSSLRPGLRHYLLTLATWMDQDGAGCWPAAQTVADAMGVKRQTVFDMQREAVAAGWLRVESKGGRGAEGMGGTGRTNRYVLLLPGVATVSPDQTVAPGPTATNRQATPDGWSGAASGQPSGHTGHQPSGHTDGNSQENSQDGETPTPAADNSEPVRALLVETWGRRGRISRRLVDEVVRLQRDLGWTDSDVRWLVTSRTADARTLSALSRRLTAAHDLSPDEARRHPGLLKMLGESEDHRSRSSQRLSSRPASMEDFDKPLNPWWRGQADRGVG